MGESAILVSAEAHAFNFFNSGILQSKNPFQSFLNIDSALDSILNTFLEASSFLFFFLFNLLLD